MRYSRASASRACSSTHIAQSAPSSASSEGAGKSPATTPLPAFGGRHVESAHDKAPHQAENGMDTEEDEAEGDKRKNIMDIEERRKQLVADEWATDVEPKQVRCRGCLRWIKLDQRSMYYRGLWDKHRDLCRGIKRLKGEYIPKRTRRSKAALALAKENESVTPIPQSSQSPVSSRNVEPRDTDMATTRARTRDGEFPSQIASSSTFAAGEYARRTRRRSRASTGSLARSNSSRSPIPLAFSDAGSRVLSAPNVTAPPAMNQVYASSIGDRVPMTPHMLQHASTASTTLPPTARLSIKADGSAFNHRPVLDRQRRSTMAVPGSPSDCDEQTETMVHGVDGRSSGFASGERPVPREVADGHSLSFNYNKRARATEDYDDENYDHGVFAPDIPSKCASTPCYHRFRFSTQRELDTYFDGATVESMSANLSSYEYHVPAGARCLASFADRSHR
ncbi:hypothetical protein FPV67DRAFT_1481359 [Lyophyllum atratum]|nr:hypothetical protein FPV67DRAFT_1481359 [Lyophyllum atratum]